MVEQQQLASKQDIFGFTPAYKCLFLVDHLFFRLIAGISAMTNLCTPALLFTVKQGKV